MERLDNETFDGFVERIENFHVHKDVLSEFIQCNDEFFRGVYDLSIALHIEIKNAVNVSKHGLIKNVFEKIFDYAISYDDAFSIFNQYAQFDLCPDFMYIYRKNIKKSLNKKTEEIKYQLF